MFGVRLLLCNWQNARTNLLGSTVTKQKLLDKINVEWHSTTMENEASTSSESKKGMSPMIVTGVIVVILILAVVGYMMTKNGSNSAQTPTSPEAQPTTSVTDTNTTTAPSEAMQNEEKVKTFEVDGANFKFTPNVLSVNEGDTVKIVFKNTQGFHDFVIDEFNVKSKTIQASQTDELTFVASKKGTFEYYCSVGNHRTMGMVGKLTVN